MKIETWFDLEEKDILNIVREYVEKQGYEIESGLEIFPKTNSPITISLKVKNISPTYLFEKNLSKNIEKSLKKAINEDKL